MVIMDKSKYQDKCLMVLENDNTAGSRSLIKKSRRKNTTNFTENEKPDYHNKNTNIYTHVDLVPASFMEQLKYKKYLKNGTVDELPIRSIVSNIGTARI